MSPSKKSFAAALGRVAVCAALGATGCDSLERADGGPAGDSTARDVALPDAQTDAGTPDSTVHATPDVLDAADVTVTADAFDAAPLSDAPDSMLSIDTAPAPDAQPEAGPPDAIVLDVSSVADERGGCTAGQLACARSVQPKQVSSSAQASGTRSGTRTVCTAPRWSITLRGARCSPRRAGDPTPPRSRALCPSHRGRP